MRARAGLGALMIWLTGCAVEVKSSDGAAGGAGVGQAGSGQAGSGQAGAGVAGAGAAGSGGAAGGEGGGAGAGGAVAGCAAGDPCGEVTELGVCAGNVLRYCVNPPLTSGCAPVLRESDCGAGASCVAAGAGARCQPKASCQAGDAYCDGDHALMTCKADGSGFAQQTCKAGSVCKAAPGTQASCEAASAEAGADHSLKGCVKFERRGMDKTGATATSVDDAWYQFVAIYNGSSYIGSALTGPDGCFDTQLSEPATEATTVYIYTIDFDEKNQPLIGLVRNTDPSLSTHSSSEYWHWSSQGDANCGLQPAKVTPSADGKHSMATMTIPEKCGSGAIRIFQWVRFAMLRLGPGSKVTSTSARKQDSVAIFWEPGTKSDCGACFLGKNTGYATITPSVDTTDTYDTTMQLSGTDEYPGHWSYSAQSQLAGLWALSSYGRMPGEGGQHFLTKPSKPGVAFSYGWATAFAQRNVSVTADDGAETDYDSLYIDTQAGTTFWVDINKLDTSTGAVQMPSATQALDQPINEFAVAAAIWRLWQPQPAGDGAFRGLGDDKIFQALGSDRILSGSNRGYSTLDLVDFLDAASCSKAATADDLDAVTKQISFPWDAKPSCN